MFNLFHIFKKKPATKLISLAELLGDSILIKESVVCHRDDNPCILMENLFKESIDLLIVKGAVEERYKTAVVQSYREYGDYMIYPEAETAMPQARPEQGVRETGLALVMLHNPLVHNGNPIRYVFGLAAKNPKSQGYLVSAITQFMRSDYLIDTLKKAKNTQMVQKLLSVVPAEISVEG